jgi:hypothetical protein
LLKEEREEEFEREPALFLAVYSNRKNGNAPAGNAAAAPQKI